MASNITFASVLASTKYAAVNLPQLDSVLDAAVEVVSKASAWTIALTILAFLVAYDQSESLQPYPPSSKL